MPTSPPQVRVPTIAPIEAFRKYHGCASPPEPSGERRPAEQSSDNKGKDAHRELLSGPESGRHAAARRLASVGSAGGCRTAGSGGSRARERVQVEKAGHRTTAYNVPSPCSSV